MWFKKKEKVKKAKCATCKHELDVEDMQVKEGRFQSLVASLYYEYYDFSVPRKKWLTESMTLHFCPMHKVEWDIQHKQGNFNNEGARYYKIIPEHEVEVNQKGKRLKKK